MQNNPVALILGCGPRLGASIAEKFVSEGYQVAIVSRSGSEVNIEGILSLRADFTNPNSIPDVFAAVKAELYTSPSVVVYNAAALTRPPDEDSVLSISEESVRLDLNVNTISPYIAAQNAVNGWKMLPADLKKTFIYTGNILNVSVLPIPMMMNLGMGKSAAAYWIGLADLTYSAHGYRFFYADERHADGSNKGMELDGPAHGEFYALLTKHKGNIPWHATFVEKQGYVNFQ